MNFDCKTLLCSINSSTQTKLLLQAASFSDYSILACEKRLLLVKLLGTALFFVERDTSHRQDTLFLFYLRLALSVCLVCRDAFCSRYAADSSCRAFLNYCFLAFSDSIKATCKSFMWSTNIGGWKSPSFSSWSLFCSWATCSTINSFSFCAVPHLACCAANLYWRSF